MTLWIISMQQRVSSLLHVVERKKMCYFTFRSKPWYRSRKVSRAQTLLVAGLRRTWEVKQWTSPGGGGDEADGASRPISMISHGANLTNFDYRI